MSTWWSGTFLYPGYKRLGFKPRSTVRLSEHSQRPAAGRCWWWKAKGLKRQGTFQWDSKKASNLSVGDNCLWHKDLVDAFNSNPADGARWEGSTAGRAAHKMFAGVEDDLHITLHADLAQLLVFQVLVFFLQLLNICTVKAEYLYIYILHVSTVDSQEMLM